MMKRRWILSLGLLVLGAVAFLLVFHPSRPLYMRHAPVSIVSADGVALAGTLSLPRWSRRPVPAVVMVHGSGPLTRRHVVGDVRRLVWEGIGVLAYDKRGAGESGGVYRQGGGAEFEAVLHRLAQDAAAAFAQLRGREEVDASRLGFFGASQAGWIIPIAAQQLDPRPRFHVILSGPAVSTGVEAFYSGLTGDGIRTPTIADPSEVRAQVAAFAGSPGWDPAPVLTALRVPTLWLLGELDQSVPTFATVQILQAIRAAGNDAHTVVVYPETDHALRHVPTGDAAPVWRDLVSWLGRQGVLTAVLQPSEAPCVQDARTGRGVSCDSCCLALCCPRCPSRRRPTRPSPTLALRSSWWASSTWPTRAATSSMPRWTTS